MADVMKEDLEAMNQTLDAFFSSKLAKELQKKAGNVVSVELSDNHTIDVDFTRQVVRVKGVRTFSKDADVQYRNKIATFLDRMSTLSTQGYKKVAPTQWRARRAKKELKPVPFK